MVGSSLLRQDRTLHPYTEVIALHDVGRIRQIADEAKRIGLISGYEILDGWVHLWDPEERSTLSLKQAWPYLYGLIQGYEMRRRANLLRN